MHNSTRRILMSCLIAISLAFLSVQLAHGQSILYGKVTGTIIDDTGEPLPGVTVEITSDALITGKRSTITSAKGSYVFLNLPVGKYTITATLESFKTVIQEDIAVSAASSITVDLTMEPGKIEETVTVTAAPPTVDSKSSTISANLESDLLEKLPTNRDAFYDLSLTTPGMVANATAGAEGWLNSPNAYGSMSNENVFLINGVNATNPRASALGSLIAVNYDSVEEVRVIALGTKAEYGNFSGVAVDVLTKSGSNKFHGNVAFYSMLGDAADNQPKPATEGQQVKVGTIGEEDLFIGAGDEVLRRNIKDWEGNFTLGGPIVRDKVWFYGGFDYVKAETEVPFFAVNSTWRGALGDIKISAEPWLNHRAWVAYHYEDNDGDGTTWDPHWDETMYYGTASINHSLSGQWQYLAGGGTILTAKYLGFWADDKPHIPDDAPDHPGYINWWKWNTAGVNGNFPYVEAQKSSRHTLQADVSHYAEDFLGEHDIKFGAQYTIGRGNWLGGYFQGYANFAYPAPWTQNIDFLKLWYGATGLVFYNRQQHINPFLTVRTSDSLGLFFDDQWSPTKRLTINLGLRFDKMTAKYGKGKVYEQPSTPEGINEPMTVLRDRQSTDNIFDFDTFAPRVGITYALTADMKTVFRASFGRYFFPLSTEFLRRFGPDMPAETTYWNYYNIPFDLVDTNGNNYVDPDEARNATRLLHGDQYRDDSFRPSWQPASEASDPSWRLKVQEGVKDQRTDQITLNLERELIPNLSASVTYIYKRTSNILVNWPLNELTLQEWDFQRVPYTTQYGQSFQLYDLILRDYNGDGVIDGGDVNWVHQHGDNMVRNMPEIDGHKPRRIYHGLQFVLKKRYSDRWQMFASFLYSTSDGMAARTRRQDWNFEGPMVTDDVWIKGLNQTLNNMEGPLPFTQKYEFKLSGSYKIPVVEVDLGVRFRYNSGRPLWPLDAVPVHSPWGNPPGSVVLPHSGTDFVVSIDPKDPWYLPSEYLLDLRVEKTFSLAGYGSLNIALDILNAFNEDAVVNAGYGGEMEPIIGMVSGLTFPSRKFRLNVRFLF
ncbi:MAG: TonB-dependent receptor [Candidatus Aenigmarchaeota archaeon]|nr:TonB-dependent receptor [Candidatus Aenigmarchaeota archaeon]